MVHGAGGCIQTLCVTEHHEAASAAQHSLSRIGRWELGLRVRVEGKRALCLAPLPPPVLPPCLLPNLDVASGRSSPALTPAQADPWPRILIALCVFPS